MFFTSDWSILLKNATSLRIYLSHNVLLCIDKVMPHWGGSFFKTFFWWYYRVQLWKESLCIFPVGGRSETMLTSFGFFWSPILSLAFLNWDSQQGSDLATSGRIKQKFQLCQSYSYVIRKVWCHQIWILNYLGFMVLILMYTLWWTFEQRPHQFTSGLSA